MIDRAAKATTAVVVGLLVSTAQTYRQVRDWLGARKAQPFRG